MNVNSERIGEIGEDIACKYLAKNGFVILERNFRMKFGEIDIICQKAGVIHFVEVKSVSRKTSLLPNSSDTHNPEDNMHRNKVIRQRRVIEAYLLNSDSELNFEIDLITVKIDSVLKQANVYMHKNIIIE